jgi:hypothetical protein
MDLNGLRRFALVALVACGTALAAPADPEPSPVAQAQAEVAALRDNDVAALFEAGQRDGLARFARQWEADRDRRRAAGKAATPMPDPLRRAWTLLLDDEGTEVLVREWHAELTGPRGAAAPGTLSIGIAGLFGKAMADSSRTPAERASMLDAMRATQAWAMRVDFSDPERLRSAVGALSKAVRATGLDDPAAFADLPFEDALAQMDGFLAAAKAIALAYDFDVDAILRSHRVREVLREGDQSTLETQFTLFGVPVLLRESMVLRDGRWIDSKRARFEDERTRRGTSEDAVTRELRERPAFGPQPAFPVERRPDGRKPE